MEWTPWGEQESGGCFDRRPGIAILELLRAPCRPAPSVAAAGCRTAHQKAHGTEVGDEVEVVYSWHPWAGRTVRVHELIERGAIASARCLPWVTPVRIRELPLWMLDAAGCRTMRVEAHPMATHCALAALDALLSAERKRHEAEPEASAITAPESRGDRHGTSSSSNLQPTPSTRTRTGKYSHEPVQPPPWTALPEPAQRTLTELLTRLLVSHAGEPIAAPAGSDADER